MNLVERHTKILELLREKRSILVTDLSDLLNVSSVTIRKDLTFLESKELLYRTHGRAVLINPYINNRNVSEKEKFFMEEKIAIGMAGAELITPKDSILIASGTTVQSFARQIKPKDHLTVITSSLDVSSTLAKHQNAEIIQLGGFLRNSSISTVGDYGVKMLKDFSCSKLFLGIDGLDLDYGLTTTNAMEALLNRAMIKISQKVIVLTDSSKFNKRGFSKICDLDQIDHIITDKRADADQIKGLEDLGIKVTIV